MSDLDTAVTLLILEASDYVNCCGMQLHLWCNPWWCQILPLVTQNQSPLFCAALGSVCYCLSLLRISPHSSVEQWTKLAMKRHPIMKLPQSLPGKPMAPCLSCKGTEQLCQWIVHSFLTNELTPHTYGMKNTALSNRKDWGFLFFCFKVGGGGGGEVIV